MNEPCQLALALVVTIGLGFGGGWWLSTQYPDSRRVIGEIQYRQAAGQLTRCIYYDDGQADCWEVE